ncbi:MAG: biotin--protein ligase [Candidatus Micrarchaeota archaeon]|nr:biotin--protein ligase [Candidatus Micrarchaeota archaeon]
MEGSARFKTPGGKLLTVKLSYSDSIEKVQILGDFFIYPEDSLEKIERGIIGISAKATGQEIAKTVGQIVNENGIEMIGITAESIGQAVEMAVKG